LLYVAGAAWPCRQVGRTRLKSNKQNGLVVDAFTNAANGEFWNSDPHSTLSSYPPNITSALRENNFSDFIAKFISTFKKKVDTLNRDRFIESSATQIPLALTDGSRWRYRLLKQLVIKNSSGPEDAFI